MRWSFDLGASSSSRLNGVCCWLGLDWPSQQPGSPIKRVTSESTRGMPSVTSVTSCSKPFKMADSPDHRENVLIVRSTPATHVEEALTKGRVRGCEPRPQPALRRQMGVLRRQESRKKHGGLRRQGGSRRRDLVRVQRQSFLMLTTFPLGLLNLGLFRPCIQPDLSHPEEEKIRLRRSCRRDTRTDHSVSSLIPVPTETSSISFPASQRPPGSPSGMAAGHSKLGCNKMLRKQGQRECCGGARCQQSI